MQHPTRLTSPKCIPTSPLPLVPLSFASFRSILIGANFNSIPISIVVQPFHLPRDPIPGDSDPGRTDSAHMVGMEKAVCRLKLTADAGADVCFIGHQNERIARINCQ